MTKASAIRTILRDEGLIPQQGLYIGDARADLEAARCTGVRFIGRVRTGDTNPFPKSVPTLRNLAALMPTRHLLGIL